MLAVMENRRPMEPGLPCYGIETLATACANSARNWTHPLQVVLDYDRGMSVGLSRGDWQGGVHPSAEERRAWFEHINGDYVSRDVLLWWRRYARTLGVQLSSATTILMPSGMATCRRVPRIREKLLISILTHLPEEMLGRSDTLLVNLLIDAPEAAGTSPGKLRVKFRGDCRQMRLPDEEGAIRAVLQPLLPDIVMPIAEGVTTCRIGLRLRVPRVASNRELVDMICELREI